MGCETGAGQGRAGELKRKGLRNWELACPIGLVDVE